MDAIVVDRFRHIADDLSVAKIWRRRHLNQDKVQLIRQGNQTRIDPLHEYAHVEEDQPYLAPFCQTAQVRALQFHIIRTIDEAGDDDLTAVEFSFSKQAFHQVHRIHRFQHRNGIDRLMKAFMTPNHLSLLHGRKFHYVCNCDAHVTLLFTFLPGDT